ncbi:S-adenosyl-L-methionine-dependent methyltransferase [Stereum hirsutum FP-91666 SS1]|uniref:S-adenosyl-L-methionine-dependent methyltransferase n=1 Tax=Stereum hirsutum (strain FP-91666) TaxID=721885 RepID=UPI0004449E4B|nr:S-adenosyl-L-methionine-dependent methyltransferase [Stereum hirsutum FP-91666 SS1]EIM83080.1 S-adenosyl-L-methionine-dependent methyltransferase [Stereum hirsutum FP-91666 SS1]
MSLSSTLLRSQPLAHSLLKARSIQVRTAARTAATRPPASLKDDTPRRGRSARKEPELIVPSTDTLELPPIDNWRSYFAVHQLVVRDRVSVRNLELADKLAYSFLDNPHTSSDEPKTVVEAFPGPGQLSRALLKLPPSKLKKLIILEDHEPYLQYLRPLEQADPRVKIVPLSGFTWATYTQLEEMGLLADIPYVSSDEVHPSFHFVTHIPHSIQGEQLVAQLFRCIPESSWLFRFGRVPMSFIMGKHVWERVSAPPGSQQRCKLSVIAEATAEFSLSLPPEDLLPYNAHWHPTAGAPSATQKAKPESRKLGHPLVSVNITPMKEQIIAKGRLDEWDYVLRRLFVLKSTALKKAIGSLAPGASVLIKPLTDESLPLEQRVDMAKQIRFLTLADWALIERAFEAWPFAPKLEDLSIGAFQAELEKSNKG